MQPPSTSIKLKRNPSSEVGSAALLIGLLIGLSRLTGIARDIGRTTLFGRNWQTDAYVSAFSIPDLIYFLASGGALSAGFVPVFSGYLAKGEDEKAVKTFQVLLTYLALLLIVLIVSFSLLAPLLVSWMFPGMREDPKKLGLTVLLARILLPAQFFFVLGSLFTGALFSLRYFAEPQMQSIIYNLLILTGGVFGALVGKGWSGGGVEGMAMGAVAGAMVGVCLVQGKRLAQAGIPFRWNFDLKDEGAQQILRLIVPVVFSLSVTQITAIILPRSFSSLLEEGAATAVEMANRVMQLPVALFGASVGIALFPTLAEEAVQDDRLSLQKSLASGLQTVLLLSVFASALMAVLREPIVAILFQYGRWSPHDTAETAWALFFYSFGVPAMSVQQVLARGFYALKDTMTPVWVGLTSLLTAWMLNIFLVHTPLQQGGLALAFSVSTWLNSALLFLLLFRRLGGFRDLRLGRFCGWVFVSAIAAAMVAYSVLLTFTSDGWFARLLRLLIPSAVAALVYILFLRFSPVPELRLTWARIWSRLTNRRR
ncbi:MAG: murein biosynthesis integral membrane protein MurJ [Armatimonadetes bacterium]|nr:murein biosynthesis integral membrane protein MurJ [Armatimonadota bacterium]MDW8121076.1 murein biosynthesis integral membrane protein MurJ [Armatimonadota bacterium]